jgi:ligand-binding SRPBCC domain-containing protein
MSIRVIRQTQRLPVSMAEAWNFFSDPQNLERITPAEMKFRVLTPDPPSIYPGQMIHYRIRLMPGISFEWLTEITHVRENTLFVDEQRSGPYAIWHHEHHFRAIEGGVEMTDIVHYKLPFGILGSIAYPFFVAPKLRRIFAYRKQILTQKFGTL